ncbi:MAG: hypothetical protein AB7P08_14190 [Burkholderiales bacterium]
MKRPLLVALLFPLAAVAGPFDQPWALIQGDTTPPAGTNLGPAPVSRVDGVSASRGRAIVEPGLRRVTVDLPPRKGFSVGTQETFELVASPCMRYHVAAKPDTADGQRWVPVVRSSESIGECLKKFRGGTTPQ